MKHYIGAATLALSFLAGCASFAHEGNLRWKDGWRKGVVTALGQGPAFSERLAASCKAAHMGTPKAERYATIRIRKNSSPVWLTVPISGGQPLNVGGWVYVNLVNCNTQLEHRPN
jgi:hypothetical protein